MAQDDRPIGEIVGRLVDDGKAYARAEIGLVRAKVDNQVDRFRPIAMLGGLAVLFGLAALVALAVTLVLSLTSLIGPLAGGMAATAIFAGIAALFAVMVKRRLGKSND
jgi:hypothetical protein